MKLWTVQPLSVYEQLSEGKIYSCQKLLCPWIDIEEIQQAYQWMAKQMENRVAMHPEGVEFPVWAWHTIGGKHKVPDLRQSLFRYYREPHVCIELEVPDNEVLLSDFDAWHMVLNDQYLDFSFSEDEYKRAIADFEKMSDDEKVKLKFKSWENIFFITPYQNSWTSIGKYVQATFWELKPEYIRTVRYIRGRK